MGRIILQDVCKTIKSKVILNHINLELEQGSVYGFWGRNGSGKTMLFRAICGLIKIDSGKISVFGDEIGQDVSFPPSLGVIIENVGFWDQYTGLENLRLLASIRKKIGSDEICSALERVGLDPADKRTYKKYSLGMKQRLGIAQAIMEQPELIVLDEPTNALDEEGVFQIRKVIQEEEQRGATVLIASHNKEDLNTLCERQFQLQNGRIVPDPQSAD